MTEQLGPLLRAMRQAAGHTLEQLADVSGLSARGVSDLERGQIRSPQRRTVVALADALGLSDAERERLIAAARAGRSRGTGARPDPWALPPPVAHFTGRERELADIVGHSARARAGEPAPVVVIHGPGGYGKSALAVRAAEALRDRFPDGRLLVDLRGTEDSPTPVVEALTLILRSLGVRDADMRPTTDALAGQVRALLADRRVLLILDNAGAESQVRPLLPGSGANLALVTSRRTLAGLDGVRRVPLQPLSPGDSARLLRAIAPSASAAESEGDIHGVALLCAGLPLALRIAGSRLTGWSVAQLRDRLTNADHRLETLDGADRAITRAFELSYAQLTETAATTFRRLAVVPGLTFTAHAAAVLRQCDLYAAEDDLDELVDVGLLDAFESERYRFHDLIRLFARRRLVAVEGVSRSAGAAERLTDWLLATAAAAGRWFESGRNAPGAGFDDVDAARAWLDRERENWLPALRTAAGDGRDQVVVDVAEALHWYSDLTDGARYWVEVFQLSHEAAARLPDRRQEVKHLNHLSWALTNCADRPEDGATTAMRAHNLAVVVGDPGQQAWALRYAAHGFRASGAHGRALTAATNAVRLFDEVGDDTGYVTMLLGLGRVYVELERHEDALTAFRSALDALGSRSVEPIPAQGVSVSARTYAALALGELGRWDEALAEARDALPDAQRLGIAGLVAIDLITIGRAHASRGEVADARDHLTRAVAILGDNTSRPSYRAAEAALAALPDG